MLDELSWQDSVFLMLDAWIKTGVWDARTDCWCPELLTGGFTSFKSVYMLKLKYICYSTQRNFFLFFCIWNFLCRHLWELLMIWIPSLLHSEAPLKTGRNLIYDLIIYYNYAVNIRMDMDGSSMDVLGNKLMTLVYVSQYMYSNANFFAIIDMEVSVPCCLWDTKYHTSMEVIYGTTVCSLLCHWIRNDYMLIHNMIRSVSYLIMCHVMCIRAQETLHAIFILDHSDSDNEEWIYGEWTNCNICRSCNCKEYV